ncbi:hypothetical protein Tsubulata_019993 [Turnera subulata]|uniref:Uncharacterized protein n=1 Tax=Turnera subulata TaxID=218843 RepID=A0A9Q0FUX8_9ROSI|nr:hypothetical protein Tsubulata_019993 [Turnera subulata]
MWDEEVEYVEVPADEIRKSPLGKTSKRARRSESASQGRHSQTTETQAQECNLTDRGHNVVSKNPIFVTNMTWKSSYIYVLRSWLEAHDIEMEEYATLYGESGELCPVKVCLGTSGSIMLAGDGLNSTGCLNCLKGPFRFRVCPHR